MLESRVSPRPVFDSFMPLVQTRALMAAVDLGVFEELRDGARDGGELAAALSLDAEALELTLRVLACTGYLEADDGRFRLTEATRATLLADSPARLTSFVSMNSWAWNALGQLEDVLRSGRGVDKHDRLADRRSWSVYQAAMLENARRLAPRVAPLVPVRPGAERLLDVGGSHGLFGALICRAHPPMSAEVLDLPEAVEQSRSLAREEGIDDVVSHHTGNAMSDELGEGYDVCFLGNLLHHFPPDRARDLLDRTRHALVPGGTVAIWELRKAEAHEPPETVGDSFALYFRILSAARCYSTAEYAAWLEGAGFEDLRVRPTPFAPFQLLITARTPPAASPSRSPA